MTSVKKELGLATATFTLASNFQTSLSYVVWIVCHREDQT